MIITFGAVRRPRPDFGQTWRSVAKPACLQVLSPLAFTGSQASHKNSDAMFLGNPF